MAGDEQEGSLIPRAPTDLQSWREAMDIATRVSMAMGNSPSMDKEGDMAVFGRRILPSPRPIRIRSTILSNHLLKDFL